MWSNILCSLKRNLCNAHVSWNLLGFPSFGFHLGLDYYSSRNFNSAHVCTFFGSFCSSMMNCKVAFAKVVKSAFRMKLKYFDQVYKL